MRIKEGATLKFEKRGKEKSQIKKMYVKSARLELTTLHIAVLHAVMALSDIDEIVRMKDKTKIHC